MQETVGQYNTLSCISYYVFVISSVAPIFTVSNVTGKHIDWILKFLNVMPSTRTRAEQDSLEQEKLEFQVLNH